MLPGGLERTPTASPTIWCPISPRWRWDNCLSSTCSAATGPLHDGTGVRDYIHVVDLARGHVAALNKLDQNCGLFICNLGTGRGYSVLDVLHAYERACGKTIPYVLDPRRPGDIAACWADPSRALAELGWQAEYGIDEMCASSWKWQSMNPNGYEEGV